MSRNREAMEPEGRTRKRGGGMARGSTPRMAGRGDAPGFWLAVGVVALTLGLRLAASLPISSSPIVMHPVLEDSAYHTRTTEIHGGSQMPRDLPRGSIIYPYIASLAPGLMDDGSRALARAQSALEAATALLLFLWIRRRWGNWAGLGAGVLYALDPVGASFAARFTPVVPATFLFVASLWAWDTESAKGASGWPATAVFTAGATLGFFLMPLPFAFLMLLRVLAALRQRRRADVSAPGLPQVRLLLPPAILLLSVVLTLAGHNALPRGGPVLGWGGGLSLSRAYDPATAGTLRRLTPPSWETRKQIEDRAWEELRREGSRYDLHRFYAARGSRLAIENPVATVGVLLSKTAGTVGAFPIPDELSPSFLTRRQAPFFSYIDYSFAMLLALAAAGFACRRPDRLTRLLGLGLLAVGLGSVLGPASAAARQPALPLLAALAGAWIAGSGGAPRFRPGAVAAFTGVLIVSLGAGIVSPSSRLREPSEDLRLSALPFAQTLAWRQAVPLLEEAVSANPRNLEARVDLAVAYRMDALHSAAETQLEAAHAADSTHARTLFELARLQSARNQPVAAASLYRELVRLHPNNPEYLNEYGRLLFTLGQMPEAEGILSRAVQLRPAWTVAQRNLQQVMAQRMMIEESLFPEELRTKADQEYLRLVPVIIQAMQSENWALADSLLGWAETERGEMAMTHWLRAGYHARRGELDHSIRELESCSRIAPGRPAVMDQLTRLYLQTGRRDRVDPALRNAIEAAGGDSTRVRALEMIRRMAAASTAAPSGS